MEPYFDVLATLDELQKDLSSRGFQLEVSEKGLYELEKKYTSDYRAGLIDKAHLHKFQVHIWTYLVEIHIRKYGGKWVFKKRDYDNEVYPAGIVCANNRFFSDFIAVLYDVLVEDIEYTSHVTISDAYRII